eukprot:Tamp_18869.p1 GENE.Tamp_18869~~Tamp_18869.p1  ORF type:complete len:399 (+),score=39.93 Tamp_18869:62-1258(+)
MVQNCAEVAQMLCAGGAGAWPTQLSVVPSALMEQLPPVGVPRSQLPQTCTQHQTTVCSGTAGSVVASPPAAPPPTAVPPAGGSSHPRAPASDSCAIGIPHPSARPPRARTDIQGLSPATLEAIGADLNLFLGVTHSDLAGLVAVIHALSESRAKAPKTNLDPLTVATLERICVDRALPSGGDKPELIARIQAPQPVKRKGAPIAGGEDRDEKMRKKGRESGEGAEAPGHAQRKSKPMARKRASQVGKGTPQSAICQHGRQRSQCRECGGASICEHNRVRSACRDCKGGSYCKHGVIRARCRECGGGSICEHDLVRSKCRDCKGGSYCKHGVIRARCRECGGGSICEHDRLRTVCRDCKGGSYCKHGVLRSKCRECGGGSICEHDLVRSKCRDCKGGSS